MSDKIKMNYPAMEDMAKHFKDLSQYLKDTQNEMASIASKMSGGALVGDAGEQFTDALLSHFLPALKRLEEKCVELSWDVQGAMVDMRDADNSAGSNF